jgi:excisionase family DNA binding protein
MVSSALAVEGDVVSHGRLITVPAAAARCGLPVSSAYAMAASGELPAVRLSPRRVRIDADRLEAMIAEAAVAGVRYSSREASA